MTPALLVNENFPASSTQKLRAAGWDVLSTGEARPSLPDVEVMALAKAQGRWLLTFDRDYGELIFSRRMPAPPAVMLLREPHYRPEEPADWLLRLLLTPRDVIGYFVVLTREGIRKRPLLRVHQGDD